MRVCLNLLASRCFFLYVSISSHDPAHVAILWQIASRHDIRQLAFLHKLEAALPTLQQGLDAAKELNMIMVE